MVTQLMIPIHHTYIGDPTRFGNLSIHKLMKEAVKDAVDSEKFNGYGPAYGKIHNYITDIYMAVYIHFLTKARCKCHCMSCIHSY